MAGIGHAKEKKGAEMLGIKTKMEVQKMEVTREEAKKMVQEAIDESRDRIRAEKAEAALQAVNDAWDRAWEKAMPRYEQKPTRELPTIAEPSAEIKADEKREHGAWQFLYGICTGALGVLIIACTVILTRML